MKQLSKNFSLDEFTRSSTAEKHGVDNTPTAKNIEALQYLVATSKRAIRQAYER